jgi:hypothetical protein
MRLPGFDVVFGLAAPAIDIFVERASVAFVQIGDDEARVGRHPRFIGLWAIFVYAPIAHWVWGPDGFLNSANDAALIKVLDFAGGTVVLTRPYPEQRILWPTFRGYGDGGGSDSGVFPSLTAIKARRAACPPEALTAFVEAAGMAQDRILVLDDFLFKPQEGQSQQSRYEQIRPKTREARKPLSHS